MSDLVGNPKDRFSHDAAHITGTVNSTGSEFWYLEGICIQFLDRILCLFVADLV